MPEASHHLNAGAAAGGAPQSPDVEIRMQALLDAIPDLMFRIAADGTYLDFAGDAELLANPWEEVVGGKVDELLPAPVAMALMGTIHRALESKSLQTVDYVLTTMRGDAREFEARVVPIDHNEVVTIVRDATDLRKTERELLAAHDRLVSARDAERRRLERNLHDGAQQRLVVALQALRVAVARLPDEGGPARDLLRVGGAARARDHRDQGARARPPPLGAHGRRPRRGARAARVPPRGAPARWTCGSPSPGSSRSSRRAPTTSWPRRSRMPPSTRAHRRARCGVVDSVDAIVIDVVDDGCGGACTTAGGGLEGLAERVSALGGELTIESAPGQGTKLHAELPVPLHLS